MLPVTSSFHSFHLPILTVATFLAFCLPARALQPEPRLIPQYSLVQIGQTANICALTFDDGPGVYTPRLLQILRKRGIRATFFLVGDRVRAFPSITRRIAEAGHEIGNHTENHLRLRTLNAAGIQREIGIVQRRLDRLGITCRLFRPPFGRFSDTTINVAKKLGLDIVLWTVDSEDWRRKPNPDRLSSPNGHDHPTTGIFLFHDIHESTIDALPRLLDYLQAAGVTFVTVSEYFGEKTPPLRPLPIGTSLVNPSNPQKISY